MSVLDTITKAEAQAEKIKEAARKEAASAQSAALSDLRGQIKAENEKIREENKRELAALEERLNAESENYLKEYGKILEDKRKIARKQLNKAADHIVKEVVRSCS